jgi:hypothetical protein
MVNYFDIFTCQGSSYSIFFEGMNTNYHNLKLSHQLRILILLRYFWELVKILLSLTLKVFQYL